MRVAISGSRSITDRQLVWDFLDRHRNRITEMVNGMAVEWNWSKDPLAGGVDRFAYDWAVHHGIPVIPMPADWSKGRGAGMMRNADIAAIAPVGIAIWDGESSGTKDFIKQMKFRGKPCIVRDLSKTEEELPFE